jgi:hypothetical protein
MNLLSQIIERLNQRIGAGNIFDQIYGLSELSADGNEKAWVHYIGNGQAVPVTNFDAHQATIFWAKRGKITVQKVDSIKLSGCKALYETKFTLSAYAVARKSHLPCDAADAQDWLASRVLRLVSGTDPLFKTSIGVVSYEVIPNGYANEVKSLTANYEFACVTIDVDVNVISPSEDGCYDTCGSGDIPLPDLIPCTPCLTEVAVDGITIIGNGTEADPLVAIGGGGGGGILVALPFSTDHLTSTGNPYTVGNVVWYLGNVYRCIAANDSILPTNATYWVNLGAGFQAVERPADWDATSGNNQILNKPTIPAAQVNSDWNASSGVAEILNKPTLATVATSGSYNDLINQPSIPPAQVNSDWNAVSGVAEILNKPSIPAAQIQSDWNQANNAAVDFIKNKPSIPSITGLVPYTGANQDVNLGTNGLTAHDLTVSHPSGSGVAVSVTKGGAGEALTVVKSSGSGNAASITGGVTLLDELHLNTDLADSYIASAATWNAKFNTPSGTTAQYVRGDGSLATFPTVPLIFKNTTDGAASSGVANTFSQSVLVPANSVVLGSVIEFKLRGRKTGVINTYTIRLYANSANNLIGSPVLLGVYTGGQTGAFGQQMTRTAAVKNATTNTEMMSVLVSNVSTDFQNTTFSAIAIDWTTDKYIIGTVQNTNAADSSLISLISIIIT